MNQNKVHIEKLQYEFLSNCSSFVCETCTKKGTGIHDIEILRHETKRAGAGDRFLILILYNQRMPVPVPARSKA